MGRLVVLSGPSCAGKGPLHAALQRLFPEAAARLSKVVLHNSRSPRPAEVDGVDYHFGSREQIDALRDEERYVVMDVRGDLQALDLDELGRQLEAGDAFFEGNPFVGHALITGKAVRRVEVLSAFLAPLSRDELLDLRGRPGLSLERFVADVMRRKLLRRTQRQKGILSLPDLEDIERRAGSAYAELKYAHAFQHVIPNHDGEDSENWSAFYYPVGDARRALLAFAQLLEGTLPSCVEEWEPDLLP